MSTPLQQKTAASFSDGFLLILLSFWSRRVPFYSRHAPSKTFNLAGLQTVVAIIPDAEVREKFIHGLNANRIFNVNWFGQSALITAWSKCDDYVDACAATLTRTWTI